jgi:aspartate racemase
MVPEAAGRARVHGIIYDELCRGLVTEPSRQAYEAIIRQGAEAGADSVILGCTEICLLIGRENSVLPVYDTTELHIAALAQAALA